jgi:hypothetical protein
MGLSQVFVSESIQTYNKSTTSTTDIHLVVEIKMLTQTEGVLLVASAQPSQHKGNA